MAATLGCMATGGFAAEEPVTADFSNQQSYWLTDPQSGCYVFYVGPVAADTVTWSGDCANGAAGGTGTATFTSDGRFVEAVSGWFRRGKAEGEIRANWADGSHFEGHAAGGRFNGKGVFTTADGSRLDGQWSKNRLKQHTVEAARDESKPEKAATESTQASVDKTAEPTTAENKGAEDNTADNKAGNSNATDKKTAESKVASAKITKVETKVAAAAAPKKAQNDPPPPVAPTTRLFDAVAGKKLVSLDGSTISLSLADGALVREIASPGAAAQKTRFAFLNAKQGTVSDAKDAAKIIGLFRATDSRLDVEYADGHSESLMPNASGGVSILLGAPGQGSLCMSWYPEGHQFSTSDRQLALALYASRLGLPSPVPAKTATAPASCATAAPTPTPMDVHQDSATSRPVPATPHPLRNHRSAARVMQPNNRVASAGQRARPVFVRSSQIHRIDAKKAAPVSVRAQQAHRIDSDKPTPAFVRSQQARRIDVEKAAPANVQLATARTLSSIAPPAQQRASTCLSIESDGTNWGFRNHCTFAVQFSYCLMDGGEVFASCHKGAVAGSVPPNGFNRLLAERATNAGQHDFRWIACNGEASQVVARLVKPDPPSGQCIPGRAS